MKEVTDSLSETIRTKVQDSEKRQHTSGRESQGLENLDQLIRGKRVLELQTFDFRAEILEVIFSDYCAKIDKKNEKYIVDYVCQGIGDKKCNVLKKTAFGKMRALGFANVEGKKENETDFDYDSSNASSYVFAKSILKQYNNGKICRKTAYGAKIQSQGIWLSGDTMNSWATTLNKFFKEYWEDYFDGSFPGEGDLLWEYLSRGENYEYGKLKKTLPLYITDFLEVVYTIGNFIPVPDGLNTGRNSILSDYWDLTLLAIYNYLTNDREHKLFKDHTSLWGLLDGNKEWLNPVEQEGIKAWNNFVVRNYIQSFVTEPINGNYGEPLPLWEEHFNLDTEGYSLPDKEQHFKQFFENARERILQRGWLIANALIENE